MSFEDILDRHHDCKIVILPRFHKGKPKLIDGLYCEDHCKLIKWLTPLLSEELQKEGVECIDPIKQDKIALMQQRLKTEYIPRGGWL